MSGLLETAQYLQTHNCSFVRFGDGEALIMNGSHRAAQNVAEQCQRIGIRVRKFKCSGADHQMRLFNILHSGYKRRHVWQSRVRRLRFAARDNRQFFLKHANLTKQYLNTQISHSYVSAGDHCTLLELIYSTLREVWRG